MNVTISWHNDNPNTIYNKLKAKIGREPTNAECKDLIFEILNQSRGNPAASMEGK